jgi:PAP2 superfamily
MSARDGGELPTLSRPAGDGAPAPRRRRTDHWIRELILVAVLYEFYNLIQHLLTGSTAQAQRNGHDVLRAERWLHLDPELSLNHLLNHVAVLAVPACYFYATLHFIITPIVIIWTYRSRRADYGRARNILVIMTVSALAGFWWFPTAPPRLLSGEAYTDTVAHYSNWGWWSADALPSGASNLANQFAAMPSLHVGWALWCCVTVFPLTRRRVVRVLAVAYPVLTTLVVMGTGNHYLLDVVAGVAVVAVAAVVTNLVMAVIRRIWPDHISAGQEYPCGSPVADLMPRDV